MISVLAGATVLASVGKMRLFASVVLGCLMSLGCGVHSGGPVQGLPIPPSGPLGATLPAPVLAAEPNANLSTNWAEPNEPGWLGVGLSAREPGAPGVRVTSVVPRSPASRAGLEVGDRLLQIAGEAVLSPREVARVVSAAGAGKRVNISLVRGEQSRVLAAELEASPDPDELTRRLFVGQLAPSFRELESVQGTVTPSLAPLRGKVLVLEFWASWCPVCRLIGPRLNQWHQRFSPQGGMVLGVTTDSVEQAGRAAPDLGMDYPIFSDPTEHTTQAYQALALPSLFVVDRAGLVRDVLVGYDAGRLNQMEQLVARLLAAP